MANHHRRHYWWPKNKHKITFTLIKCDNWLSHLFEMFYIRTLCIGILFFVTWIQVENHLSTSAKVDIETWKKTANIWAHELYHDKNNWIHHILRVCNKNKTEFTIKKSGHFDEKSQMPLAFINYYYIVWIFPWCALYIFVHHLRSCHICAYTSQVSLETTLLSIRPHTQFYSFVCCYQRLFSGKSFL